MKEFIKKHPWRLEILPLICVIFALVVPLIYREESLRFVRKQHGLSEEQTWLGWFLLDAFILVITLCGNVLCNHLSIDRKKDWYLSIIIAVFGFSLTVFSLRHYTPVWVFIVWGVLIVSSLVVQRWLLRTLPVPPEPCIPAVDFKSLLSSESELPKDAVKPGELFYYREIITHKLPRDLAAKTRLFTWLGGAVLIGIILLINWWTSKDWQDMVGDMIWPALMLIGMEVWDHIYGKGTFFSVTPKRIKIRTDSGKKINIRMADVTGCEVVEAAVSVSSDEHFMMQIDFDEISKACKASSDEVPKELQYMANVLRRLEIHTRSGKTYGFRLNDPDKVCGLITAAMGAKKVEGN